MSLEMSLEQYRRYQAFTWPPFVEELFPALFIFHRKNKPKPRKGFKHGYNYETEAGKAFLTDPTLENAKGLREKKTATPKLREQNNYWVYAVVLTSPDSFGTIKRNFIHKGYGELAGMCFATEEEVADYSGGPRFIHRKFKSFMELYNVRRVPPEREREWKALCERMESLYPTQASGQLRLL